MLKNYRAQNIKEYEMLPNPYWKRINEKILFPEKVLDYNKDIIVEKNFNNVMDVDEELCFKYIKYLELDKNYGLGEKFLRFSEGFSNTGLFIDIEAGDKRNRARIDLNIDSENPILVDHNLIICRENSELDIFINYEDDKKTNGFHNGFTKIYAEKGAKLNLYKIQNYSQKIQHFDSSVIFVDEDAEVNIIDVQLGSKLKGVNYDVELKGDRSFCDIKNVYLGTDKDKMDFNYDINFLGRNAKGYVESVGALTDKAWKVFRSTENFKKGCKKSEGSAKEYVTLLNKDVKSHAIPALFCTEDDVIGDHAASAGQLDGNKMFYLMNRGLDKEAAKILVVESSFVPILEGLPEENTKKTIINLVKDRLGGD